MGPAPCDSELGQRSQQLRARTRSPGWCVGRRRAGAAQLSHQKHSPLRPGSAAELLLSPSLASKSQEHEGEVNFAHTGVMHSPTAKKSFILRHPKMNSCFPGKETIPSDLTGLRGSHGNTFCDSRASSCGTSLVPERNPEGFPETHALRFSR